MMQIPSLSGPLVLVVDDDESVRQLFRRTLTTAGFVVDVATDGFEGIAAAKRLRPDAILLDGDLPVFDGFEVCRALKGQDDTASIPIIFVTGMGAPPYRDSALEAGANVFVTKPVDLHQLVKHVRSVTGHERPPP
jgi:DNA-binding response OmpR family regulator